MVERGRIPPLELEAMKVLWDLGQATVRQVQMEMSRRRPLAYTTVMTLLDRLTRRGAAERRKQGRAHLYHPLLARETAREMAIERLTHDFFDGSRERLAAHLHGEPATADIVSEESALDTVLL